MSAELRQIRYFVAVARHGSFAAAAETLHVSQPAVGQQVRNLEHRLGAPLLERHARGARLTPAGKVFLHHAEQVLRQVAAAERSVAPFQRVRPRKIVVGATPSAGRALAPHLMAACADDPQLKLSIRQVLTEEALRLFERGELDIALCYGSTSNAVRATPLYAEPFCLVGPQGPSRRTSDEVPYALLARHKLILDPAVRELAERAAISRDVQLNVVAEVEPASLTLELMARTGSYSILTRGLFAEEIAKGQAFCCEIKDPSLVRTLYFNASASVRPADTDLTFSVIADAVRAAIVQGDLGWRAPPA